MTDLKARLVRTETIHFPRNTADDHSEDREVLVNPDGPEAAARIAELEAARDPEDFNVGDDSEPDQP